jgi:hypothetical protein
MDEDASADDLGDQRETEARAIKIMCPWETSFEVCGPIGEVDEDFYEQEEEE